jgi:hypothetical protein
VHLGRLCSRAGRILVAGPHGFDVRLIGLFADSTPATRAWTVIRGWRPLGRLDGAWAPGHPRSVSREQTQRGALPLLDE